MKFTINQNRNIEAMRQRKFNVTYLGLNKWKIEDKTLNHLEYTYTFTCLGVDDFTIQYKDKYDDFLVHMNNKMIFILIKMEQKQIHKLNLYQLDQQEHVRTLYPDIPFCSNNKEVF